jgi:hypothetical protein
MSETFDLFGPTTSGDTPNATSSPGSGSGATPSDKPGGLMARTHGPEAAPAKPSAGPGAKAVSTMSAISGRTGKGSSASSDLAWSLASRLQAVTASLGSTLFALTWKPRVTPSRRLIYALRASVPPHIRQRLFFVADAGRRRVWDRGQQLASQESEAGGEVWEQRLWLDSGHGCSTSTVGDPAGIGQSGRREHHGSEAQGAGQTEAIGCELREQVEERRPTGGFWGDAEWIRCLDGKARPVEPGTSPLAHGSSSRMGRLRAYGNAINAEVAAGFIRAYRMTRYCSTPQEEKGR